MVITRMDTNHFPTVEVESFAGASAGINGMDLTIEDIDGVGSDAILYNPKGGAIVGNKLYFSDMYQQVIRYVDMDTAEVVTVAGQAGMTGFVDGVGTDARFYWDTGDFLSPGGCATDPDGKTIYISDGSNSAIRALDTETNEVTTFCRRI